MFFDDNTNWKELDEMAKKISKDNICDDIPIPMITMDEIPPSIFNMYKRCTLKPFNNKTEDNMNIAKIKYYEQDGMYYYEDWENLLTQEEIIDKYGKGVWYKYTEKAPSMVMRTNQLNDENTICIWLDGNCIDREEIKKNVGYKKDRFSELNILMKQAGANLVEAIREAGKKKRGTIEI